MLSIHVALVSGREVQLEAADTLTVWDLKRLVQQEVGHGISDLVSPTGALLENECTLASLSPWRSFTATLQRPKIVASRCKRQLRVCDGSAFALIRSDGSVATWGHAAYGADSSSVQPALREVKDVCGSMGAFVALRADGRMVAWGDPEAGGDLPGELQKLQDVRQLQSSTKAFAAVRANGQVVTWGGDACSKSSFVQEHLHDVFRVAATDAAFCALRRDGQVVCWGFPPFGGGEPEQGLMDLGPVPVVDVVGSGCAFAALKADGSVRTWGVTDRGGTVPAEKEARLQNVRRIAASYFAFCAVRADGRLVAWGNGKVTEEPPVSDVGADLLVASAFAFAARCGGRLAVWGAGPASTPGPEVQAELSSIQDLVASQHSFLALRSDGRLVQWGKMEGAGPSGGVAQIFASPGAYAAILQDGRVICWGSPAHGGECGELNAWDGETIMEDG